MTTESHSNCGIFCTLLKCAVGWGVVLHAGRSRVRSRWCHWNFSLRNHSGCTMALGLTQPLTEMSTRNISWGQRWPERRADNTTTFMCRLSWNLGTSTSWNPPGLSRLVMGLPYLCLMWRHTVDRYKYSADFINFLSGKYIKETWMT